MANVGFNLDLRVKVKTLFFDRASVQAAVSRAEAKVLSKAGAFIRRRVRSSIRKRRRVSEPGQPPSSHTGLLKDNIFFAFEPNTRSVVIGPVPIGTTDGAPQRLEFGGTRVVTSRGESITQNYRPRPYMGPALEAEAPNFPQLFKDSAVPIGPR